ncbi:MAG: VOC family protein [Fimbriimonadaceae bacterium]|nr:VOC family protein [Fimbriimonadaceae bacterium]
MSETIYYVHDLDEAVESYQKQLGFNLILKQDWGWALLELHGGKIGLLTEAVWKQSGEDYDGMPRPKMAFQTDDIEGEVTKLKEAGADVDDLHGEPGSMRAVTFRDLCGNEFFLWDDGCPLT